MSGIFDDADIIHSYSRAQAIEDGFLVDITAAAAEAGFTLPVAMTRTAWADTVEWSEENAVPQDESARLWDVVWMASWAARTHRNTDRVEFEVLRVLNTPGSTSAGLTHLVLHIGPGDTAAPVITIMLPGED